MSTDLYWDTVDSDVERERREAQVERIRTVLAERVWPFISMAETHEEYLDRCALAAERIEGTIRAHASSEADYLSLYGEVTGALDEDFNSLRQRREAERLAQAQRHKAATYREHQRRQALAAQRKAMQRRQVHQEAAEAVMGGIRSRDARAHAPSPQADPEDVESEAGRHARRRTASSWALVNRSGELVGNYSSWEHAHEVYMNHLDQFGPAADYTGVKPREASRRTAAKWRIVYREQPGDEGFGAIPTFEVQNATGVRIDGQWERLPNGDLLSPPFEATEGQAHDFTEMPGFVSLQREGKAKTASSFDPRRILIDIDNSAWRAGAEHYDMGWQDFQGAVANWVMDQASSNLDAAERAAVAINDMAMGSDEAMDIQQDVSDVLEAEGIDQNARWHQLMSEFRQYMRSRTGSKTAATYSIKNKDTGEVHVMHGFNLHSDPERALQEWVETNQHLAGSQGMAAIQGLQYHYTVEHNRANVRVFDGATQKWLSKRKTAGLEALDAFLAWADNQGTFETRREAAQSEQAIQAFLRDHAEVDEDVLRHQLGQWGSSRGWTSFKQGIGGPSGYIRFTIEDEHGETIDDFYGYEHDLARWLSEFGIPDNGRYSGEHTDEDGHRISWGIGYPEGDELDRVEEPGQPRMGKRKKAQQRKSFDDWMDAVDRVVERRAMVSVHDLADQPFMDWYDSGMSPAEAAAEALRSEGFTGSRKTAMQFDDSYPAGYSSGGVANDHSGDPIIFHTQTYQVLGSPGSRYKAIGVQTRQHSMALTGSDARLVLSEDGQAPTTTSGGRVGGNFNVIPVAGTTGKRGGRRPFGERTSASSYAGDPYWLTTRYPGTCSQCGASIAKGDRAFYWPRGKKLHCETCGERSSAQFDAEVADEDFLGGYTGARTARDEQAGKRRHKLLPRDVEDKLPKLYSTENIPLQDKVLHVKFFTPFNNWTWYGAEFDGQDTFFGYVKGLSSEWGYFSLDELERLSGPGGIPGVERDIGWGPHSFEELQSKPHLAAKPKQAGAPSTVCPKCGADMNPTIHGNTLYAECDECGWTGTKTKAGSRGRRSAGDHGWTSPESTEVGEEVTDEGPEASQWPSDEEWTETTPEKVSRRRQADGGNYKRRTAGVIQVHEFGSSYEAYNATQVRDEIKDGDVLSCGDGVVGFVHDVAWPVAVTTDVGEFHGLAVPWEQFLDDNPSYRTSYVRAVQEAKRRDLAVTATRHQAEGNPFEPGPANPFVQDDVAGDDNPAAQDPGGPQMLQAPETTRPRGNTADGAEPVGPPSTQETSA